MNLLLWLRKESCPPGWHNVDKPIKRELDRAFKAQSNIGWDQFFCGHIAKKAWSIPICMYYNDERQPGHSFTHRINGCKTLLWLSGHFLSHYGINETQSSMEPTVS
jgi:hypothetical protein